MSLVVATCLSQPDGMPVIQHGSGLTLQALTESSKINIKPQCDELDNPCQICDSKASETIKTWHPNSLFDTCKDRNKPDPLDKTFGGMKQDAVKVCMTALLASLLSLMLLTSQPA